MVTYGPWTQGPSALSDSIHTFDDNSWAVNWGSARSFSGSSAYLNAESCAWAHMQHGSFLGSSWTGVCPSLAPTTQGARTDIEFVSSAISGEPTDLGGFVNASSAVQLVGSKLPDALPVPILRPYAKLPPGAVGVEYEGVETVGLDDIIQVEFDLQFDEIVVDVNFDIEVRAAPPSLSPPGVYWADPENDAYPSYEWIDPGPTTYPLLATFSIEAPARTSGQVVCPSQFFRSANPQLDGRCTIIIATSTMAGGLPSYVRSTPTGGSVTQAFASVLSNWRVLFAPPRHRFIFNDGNDTVEPFGINAFAKQARTRFWRP